MAHDPKLEIFKIKLLKKEDGRPTTFREFFRSKFNQYSGFPTPITPEVIFKAYHADFIKQTDQKSYNLSTKNKGFSIAYDEDGDGKRKSHISFPSGGNMILDGILQGGKHGIKRWLGDVSDTSIKTDINKKNIVNDRFYFLLFTPLDHSQGVLMVQGYTESKISDVFREYLSKYFKYQKEIESKFELFVPKSFQKGYLEKATFKKLLFTSAWKANLDFSGGSEKEYELEVKIEIIDKSAKKSGYKETVNFISALGKSLFKVEGGKEKSLSDFEKKNAKMESRKKEFPVVIDDEDNIKPVILLKDQGINVSEDGLPDFNAIKEYSRNLLKDVVKEILPTYAVNEL